MKNTTNIVFFGSGPVAARSLQLLSSHFVVEAIITKPVTLPEMQAACTQSPVYVVGNKHELNDLLVRMAFKSKVGVLIDFGIIVDRTAISRFSLGIINSHFSLLPQWRGADPITFSILSGQQQTGVSIMLITEGIDEGPLLAQSTYLIPADATTPMLTDALIEISDTTLKAVLSDYIHKKLFPVAQEQASLLGDVPPTYSRKLTKEDGIINWSKPAIQIEREIRAYITWPKSRTRLANQEIILTKASVCKMQGKPGEVIVDGKHLYVCCGHDALEILRLKPAGKTDMPTESFLAGYRQLL